jgi:ketosteroid isomerase-like protein
MDEAEIREVVEGKAAALRTGDVKLVLGCYANEVVEYSLAPPLRQPADAQDPAPMERWLAALLISSG